MGPLLLEVVRILQLSPPRVFAYEMNHHFGDDDCWFVEIDILARLVPTPGLLIEIRESGEDYQDTLEWAVQCALSELVQVYRRDLADTPYPAVVEALESRARDVRRRADALQKKAEEEKEKLKEEIRVLKDQLPRVAPPRRGRVRIRTTARKRIVRERVYFRIDWHDELSGAVPPPAPPAPPAPVPVPPVPVPAQQPDPEEEEEEPMEREWYSSEDTSTGQSRTGRSRFSKVWLED